MSALPDLPPLREIIKRYDLRAKKGFGQHFLLDLNLTRRVARGAGDLTGVTVIEIGPGPGGLTRPLLESKAAAVIAVERDPRFIEALGELAAAAGGRLRIVEADALEVDVTMLAPAPRAIVSNLPYNVGTPLLFGWLKQSEAFRSLTLMFQKEVVDRLVAAPGSKTYGRLSVMAQWRAECRPLFDIAAQAFTPPPNVTSAVVHLVPRAMAADEPPFGMMERVVAAAFGQRRKMLRASLRAVQPDPEPFLEAAGIAPTARAEEIPVAGFRRLAMAFGSIPHSP